MPSSFSQTARSLERDGSHLATATWVVAIVFLSAWAYWFFVTTVDVYEVSSRARVEVLQSTYPAQAPVSGTVASAALAIGAVVRDGDVLVTLDDSTERSRLQEERAHLLALEPKIASLLREIETRQREKSSTLAAAAAAVAAQASKSREADAAEAFARDYEQRMKQLSAEGLVPTVDAARAATETQKLAAARDSLSSELERLRLDADARANQHDAAVESLQQSVAALRGELATSEASVARLTHEVQRRVIRAPASGRLGSVLALRAGTVVSEGQQVATIVPDGTLVLVADFDPSRALGRLRPGQRAHLRLDGFPWAQFGTVPARVTRVASELRDGLLRAELTMDVDPARGVAMQHGLPGTVEVAIEAISPATLVLRAAGLQLSTLAVTAGAAASPGSSTSSSPPSSPPSSSSPFSSPSHASTVVR